MAIRRITILEDDLDGGHADEAITFTLDGAAYEIDLNTENATTLRAALAPYAKAGRKVRASSRASKRTTTNSSEATTAEVRSWAQEQGLSVNTRGRIQADVLDKYRAAHP